MALEWQCGQSGRYCRLDLRDSYRSRRPGGRERTVNFMEINGMPIVLLTAHLVHMTHVVVVVAGWLVIRRAR
jgi:hypothetical protein